MITMRMLLEILTRLAAEQPNHEAFDQQVVVRINTRDDELHAGGLVSAVVDAGCAETFALVLDADQEPR